MGQLWDRLASEINLLLGRKAAVANFDIGQMTTYRTIAKCTLFVQVENQEELLTVSSVSQKAGVKIVVIGNGSNLLISDSGFNGLVVKLGNGFESMAVSYTHMTLPTSDLGEISAVGGCINKEQSETEASA